MNNVKQLLSAWNCIWLVHIKENLIHSSKWSLWYIWGKWLRWLYYDKTEPEAFYPFVCWFYALSLYCGSMLFDCIVAGLWIMAAQRRQLHPTPVLLPGKSRGQRSLVGCTVHRVTSSPIRLSDFTFMHWRRKWQPTPVFLPGESQGRRSLVGCCLWGRTESDMTEAT